MKKIAILAILFLSILFLATGCEKRHQTLTCTNTQEENGYKIHTKATTNFENNKVVELEMTLEMVLEDNTYLDMMKEALESQYSSLSNQKGFEYNVSTKDNSVVLYMKINGQKANKETKKALGFVGSEKYSVNKKSFEKLGYTCK